MEGVRCPRIVGRADELDALRQAVERVRGGHGSVQLLLGEAGVGKSRLAAAVAGHAEEAGLLGATWPGGRRAASGYVPAVDRGAAGGGAGRRAAGG